MLQGENSAILSTFIKLPVVFKIFVLSYFEWLLKTSLTVDPFENLLGALDIFELPNKVEWKECIPSK